MNPFVPRKIKQNNPGSRLRQARQNHGLSLEEVSKKTDLKTSYLLALEENRFDKLPAGIYGKRFLKEYADYLQLDYQKLLTDFSEQSTVNYSGDPFSQKIVKPHKLMVFPRLIRNLLILSAVVVISICLFFYLKKIVSPPMLTIFFPPANLLTSDTSLVVSGQSENGAEVKINNELMFSDLTGNFSKKINLKRGTNFITISAKKKYGREAIITRQIISN